MDYEIRHKASLRTFNVFKKNVEKMLKKAKKCRSIVRFLIKNASGSAGLTWKVLRFGRILLMKSLKV